MNILVVEDQPDSIEMLRLSWSDSRDKLECLPSARRARRYIHSNELSSYDCMIIDINLPDGSGLELLRETRERSDIAVVMISGAGNADSRADAISVGADDYIMKPPPMRELVARIRAVHRRLARGKPLEPPPSDSHAVLRLAHAEVDLRRRVVIAETGERTALTGAESKALEMLLAARGEPLSREALCREALRRPLGSEDRAVDQLIVGLRKKLCPQNGNEQVIVSVRGAGYALQT